MTLNENFALAYKRNQPYINLVNEIYSIEEIASDKILKEIKHTEIKSLYLRTEVLNLDEQFIDNFNKLVNAGIREILILCDTDKSQLSKLKLNDFLQKSKIYINFNIAPISKEDIATIREDEICKKDLLGFENFKNYQFTYKNGAIINLLNNEETDKIILANHAEHRKHISLKHEFKLSEPEYIISNKFSEIDKREKTYNKNKSSFNLEVTKNIDLKVEINKETEEENELDLDKEQNDNKFTQIEALEKIEKFTKALFLEHYIIKSSISSVNLDDQITDIVNKIFKGHKKIEYISSKALYLVIKNNFLLEDGIDFSNLPVGLAFKNGILFATEQRLHSMPINEFTIKFDAIKPEISNPLLYSWLKFASKASLSLNDIYGSDIAPKINGKDEHPTVEWSSGDIMLDIPYNQDFSHYSISQYDQRHNIKSSTYRDFIADSNSSKINYFGMSFFNIFEADINRLNNIQENLIKRNLLEIFTNIVSNGDITDGGFLFKNEAALFLDKLFNDILPITKDTKKIDFFYEILKDYQFKKNSNLENIFEGLDGFYKKFQEFLFTLDIKDTKTIENKVVEIIKNPLNSSNNLKAILSRFINILDNTISNGGSLSEQIEYLSKGDANKILKSPQVYLKAKEFSLNIIHESSLLDKTFSYPEEHKFLEDDLLSYLTDTQYIDNKYINYGNTDYYSNNVVANSLKYLSHIAPHKRVSIDTYYQYFKVNTDHLPHKSNTCSNSADEVSESLKTVDYSFSDKIGYRYPINSFSGATINYLTYFSSLELVKTESDKLNHKHLIIAILGKEIHCVYNWGNFSGSFILSGEYIDFSKAESLIKYYAKYNNAQNHFYELNEQDTIYIFTQYIDLLKLISHPAFSEYFDNFGNENPLRIEYHNNGDYDISFRIDKASERVILNKSELLLPKTLDQKIKDFHENGANDTAITLFYDEIKDTIFEKYSHSAFDFAKEELTKNANNDINQLKEIFNNAPKGGAKNFCFSSIGIITDEINLVNNFTTDQAILNTKLLVLNILGSNGRHYNAQYPDQEFSSYLSLFNLLFSKFKIYEDIKIYETKYGAEENFNSKTVYIGNNVNSIDKSKDIKDKEEQHRKTIDKFINIYKENNQFNFAQIVSLGLIANLDQNLADLVIENAKILNQYNGYFTQALRILLSIPISKELNLDELNARAMSIAKNINILVSLVENDGNKFKIHELLTENGAHPENLIFFVSCLSQDSEITYNKVVNLTKKVSSLDDTLKKKLLNIFEQHKLPFAGGEIINNDFPLISLETLGDESQLQQLIEKDPKNEINYKQMIRFNDISLESMENAKIDLTALQEKYGIQVEHEYSYAELKAALIKDQNFIVDQLKTKEKIELELVSLMLQTISKDEGLESRIHTNRLAILLYNHAKPLGEQYLEIELNKRNIDLILNNCKLNEEKEEILEFLGVISQEKLEKALNFLKSIDLKALKAKNYTIAKLMKAAGTEIMDQHLEAFIIVTKKFINEDVSIELPELYNYIRNISLANYRASLTKQIIEYCLENNDYLIIATLQKLDGRADNIEKIINWITRITPAEIKDLHNALDYNVKSWLEVKQIDKVQIIGDIVLNLQTKLQTNQYKQIIKHINQKPLAYAKLLQSYLVTYDVKDLPIQNRIELVMKNLNELNNVQIIFSEYNLARFEYKIERVSSKINEILLKNIEDVIPQESQEELNKNFIAVLNKAKEYKDLDVNQIHEKAIVLKHNRMLKKDADSTEIFELDLEFLGLSFELLYQTSGRFPRDVQVLSNLNSFMRYESIIEEIATGQGKSIITALHAVYLWFIGQTVDVVSSSQELASRDLKEFSALYDILGIKHSNEIITAESYVQEYKKGGINYATASDLALFRANREFYSNTNDISLNADVSLICDEVDFVLTSEVNYKLATPLINTNQAEARTLFGYILEFSETTIFKNDDISRQDDIKNLQLYLYQQLLEYDTSYKYPLNAIQVNELKISEDPTGLKLYILHKALVKADKEFNKLFDKLLDAVIIAKTLEDGVDYVLIKEDLDNYKELLKATPIIKDQPSKGTSFGDGVQAFLHLLIERGNPTLENRFDIASPSSTIFNISPKNFFDYYRLTGGRIIGLTGTAGNADEIEEFRTNNKMLSYKIPRFELDRRQVTEEIVKNKIKQTDKMIEILQSMDSNRPVIIFCENTKEAEEIYNKINIFKDNVQLRAASRSDTGTTEEVINKAGRNGYITITTPMLGRGADFLTEYNKGFLDINLCTKITQIILHQLYGRVARNGQEGEVISLFNKEIFGNDIIKYMDSISTIEKEIRMKSQPLTDILKFFNQINHDNALAAITCNDFIKNNWDYLLKNNIVNKTYLSLRTDLVDIVKVEYPMNSNKLDDYLIRIDNGTPAKIALECLNIRQYFKADYVIQNITESNESLVKKEKLNLESINSIQNTAFNYGTSISISKIELPVGNGIYVYNSLYRVQAAKMATHVFTIEDLFFKLEIDNVLLEREFNLLPKNIDGVIIYLDQNKLFYRDYKYNKYEIKIGYTAKEGISNDIYEGIVNKIKQTNLSLDLNEKNVIRKHVKENGKLISHNFEGDGSGGDLMVDEFKKSFAAYKEKVNSVEVNKISPFIENFMNVKNLDLSKLEYGKYQAIHIVTLFTSSSSHVESLLTDGKFLFWINRGGGSGNNPGIKVFKIIKDISQVKEVLEWLKIERSQADTRAKIYSLLREENDQNIPEFVVIPMKAQKIGNCGWTQTKGMLKAVALVGRIGNLNELPDIQSQEWQKAVKDSNDIYKDFTLYDRVQRLEAIIFTIDSEFKPIFLSDNEQKEINSRRDILENPITEELLEKLNNLLKEKSDKFENTIYEKQINHIKTLINLEVALNSEMGVALERISNREIAKTELKAYQINESHDFEQLSSIYKSIKESRLEFTPMQDILFKQMIDYLNESGYNIIKLDSFNDKTSSFIKECIAEGYSKNCVLDQLVQDIEKICLPKAIDFYGDYS